MYFKSETFQNSYVSNSHFAQNSNNEKHFNKHKHSRSIFGHFSNKAMPQGAAKTAKKIQKTNKKTDIRSRPKRVWKKRRDPISAAVAKKVEAVVMQKALKDPMHGGMRFLKPSEDKTKAAGVSTKSLIKDPNQKIK